MVQRVTISANFSFFQIREEPTTKDPKENSLNIEEDLWIKSRNKPLRRNINSKSQEWEKQLFADLIKISVLKNFAIITGKHLCWSLFLRKLQVLKPATLLKGDSNNGVFL